MYKMDLADLKLEGSKAYNEKDYSTAVKLYSVVCCMTQLFVPTLSVYPRNTLVASTILKLHTKNSK